MRAFSKFWSILILIVFIYFIFIDIRNYLKLRELNNKRKTYIEQIKQAQQDNRQLKKNLIELDNDSYLEELIRNKLGLVKKEEIIYKFINNKE